MSDNIDKIFWQSKKILLTGHTGFKGSWLSLWLQHLGAEVIGYSQKPPTNPNLFSIANVISGMVSIMGDVRDYSHLHNVCEEYQPDIIIHMAAQSLVKYSYTNPLETFSTNITGTVNVLEVARDIGCAKSIVIITSDKCYENKINNHEHIESDAMGGHDPYSSSKGCAELITKAYIDSFFNPRYTEQGVAVASARSGNAIGGGDWAKDRLITDIINSYLNNKPLEIRYPEAIRPWQHVLEPLSGYLLLAEKLYKEGVKYSGAWNFGPNENNNRTVNWIVEKVSTICNKEIDWSVLESSILYESDYLTLDCNKSKQELLWCPRLDMESTLKWIIDWYIEYQGKYHDMKSFTIEQIKQYELIQ